MHIIKTEDDTTSLLDECNTIREGPLTTVKRWICTKA